MQIADPLNFLGSSFTFQDTRDETLRNIKLIIRIRFFVTPSIFIIMFIAGIFGYTRESAFSENQIIVNGVNFAFMLIMNVVYLLLVRRVHNLRPLVFFQIIIDVVHYTLTVYKTGGGASPFTFLYLMVIFASAMIVTGKTAYLTAGLCSLSFTGIVVLEVLNIIPHQDFFSPYAGLQASASYLVLTWLFTVFSLFAFAALAAYLITLSQRKELDLTQANQVMIRKNETMLLLYRTSKSLSSFNTVDEVVEYILHELLQHLNLDRALLYLNADGKALKLQKVELSQRRSAEERCNSGLNVEIPLDEEAGLTARCAVRQEAYNIKNPEESELINKELAAKIGMNPFAMSPLILRGKTVGVIGIDRSFENGSITDDEFRILQMFANQAALTIHSLLAEKG